MTQPNYPGMYAQQPVAMPQATAMSRPMNGSYMPQSQPMAMGGYMGGYMGGMAQPTAQPMAQPMPQPMMQPMAQPMMQPQAQPMMKPQAHSMVMGMGGGQPGMPPIEGKYVDTEFPPVHASIFGPPGSPPLHTNVMGPTDGGRSIEWRRVGSFATKLFNSVHPNDIAQGTMGDCWLLAAISALAEDPARVHTLFKEQEISSNGQYSVRIYNMASKTWHWVTIDDYIPFNTRNNQPLFSKPNGDEAWVLLLEKALAKWFGNFGQLDGGSYGGTLPFMFLTSCGPCQVFAQRKKKAKLWDVNNFSVSQVSLPNPRNKQSAEQPIGECNGDQAFQYVKFADDNQHLMSAWTQKPPDSAAGTGASGEVIGSDGVVQGHAYAIVSADLYQSDKGEPWRIVQIRNPWGGVPNAEWNGELSDNWPGWAHHPRLKQTLGIDMAQADGLFYMRWEDFCRRFSHFSIAPDTWATEHGTLKYCKQETSLARGLTTGPPPDVKRYQSSRRGGSLQNSAAPGSTLMPPRPAGFGKKGKKKKERCC